MIPALILSIVINLILVFVILSLLWDLNQKYHMIKQAVVALCRKEGVEWKDLS